MLKKLTKKQRELLNQVLREPKTYQELSDMLGITRQGVYDRVKRMRKKGYLKPEGKIEPTPEGISSINVV